MRDRSFENQRYRASGLTLVTAAIVLWNTVYLERAIGANASGKSAILDALRFLREGIHEGDFASPVRRRGNMVHLAWKGEPANQITLETQFSGENGSELSWLVKFQKAGYDFVVVEERIHRRASPGRPQKSY
jgi:predicted ATPase